jgi:DNA-binding NarL/FixJ family response regulator
MGARVKHRVGIIDDNPAAVLGLTAIINAEPDMHVVASASTASALLREESRFHVVMLNLDPGDPHAVERTISALSRRSTRVVAYVSPGQPHLVRDAAQAGASAVVFKTDHPRRIPPTLRAVLRTGDADPRPLPQAVSGVDAGLSAREQEVLSLYATGETASRVAAELFLSKETVIDHIKRIRGKYAAVDRPARSRVDLFRRAVEDGLVPPS